MSTIKNAQVKNRDSATALLRKVGITKDNYNTFISCGEDGLYFVNLEDAVRSLTPPTPAKIALSALVVFNKKGEISYSLTIRNMVRQEMTNKEIADELKLPANKTYYPAWYRAEIIRKNIQ